MLLVSYIQSMLTTIAFILIILWAIGFLGFHVLGSFIHLLLVIAIVLVLLRVIKGESPLS
jgi:hypothetical protein